MFATWRCRNFRAWCPAGRSCSSSDRVNSPKDFFLEGSNDDDLGTVTAQQQRQQQQQAIDLIRLRNSVWITALVTAERRQQRLIQACKIRDLYHSIRQNISAMFNRQFLSTDQHWQRLKQSIPYMYIIEFYSFLKNLNNLLPFYYSFSSENPSLTPRSAAPCQSTKSTKLIQHLKSSYYQETKRPTKNQNKKSLQFTELLPIQDKNKLSGLKNWVEPHERQSSAIHYYEDDHGCFVLFFLILFFLPKKLATESRWSSTSKERIE